MQSLFLNLHLFISKHKAFFVFVLISLLIATGFFISRITVKEDLSAIIPKDERINKVTSILNNSKFADRIIFNISCNDTAAVNPDALIDKAEIIVNELESDTALIKKINFRISNEAFADVYDFVYDNLPLYLTDNDYVDIKKRLTSEEINKTLEADFRNLISPTGIATRKFIFKDPLNLAPIVLKRLENFQLDKNFDVYNSCIFTKDRKHLLVFLDPVHSANNIQENKKLIEIIDLVISKANSNNPDVKVEYYGGTAVAIANASQIKMDIFLTVTITFLLLSFVFLYFFRKVRTIFLLFFPVILGAAMAIALMSIFNGQISSIVLGIGSVLLAMAVDYTVYAVTYFKSSGSVLKTIKDISGPLMMGALSTIFSFLCLYVVHSEALWQLGLFAALSIFITALLIMIVLPFFLRGKKSKRKDEADKRTFFDAIAEYRFDKNRWLVWGIIILTIIFTFTSRKVEFNSDLNSLNFLTKKLKEADKNLKAISSETSSAVYIITQGSTLSDALSKTEELNLIFDKFKAVDVISTMSSASDLIITEEKQKQRIAKWNSFWREVDAENIKNELVKNGRNHHFKDGSFDKFYGLLDKKFEPKPVEEFQVLQKAFLSNYIYHSNDTYSTVSILKVECAKKDNLFKAIEKNENAIIFDNQYYVNQFFDILKEDFDLLVLYSSIIVFGILLLSFGRIEIAAITFVPIIVSWIWTVGLMGLFGIEFNIFNIIITTFIFGCGDDYAIYIMSGLLDDHKYGNKTMVPYKLSVLLSALTIISGVGVLIFAQHPALQSIAIVSIFGLTSVVIISYTILPAMFTFFIRNKGRKLLVPITLRDFLYTIFAFLIFLLGVILLTIIIPTLIILPIRKKYKKQVFSYFIYKLSRFVRRINFLIKHIFIDQHKFDLSNPAVIISNHQSHIDLVLILMLHPKIIVLTNKWVWNNPFYGLAVRFADYFPVYKGMEHGFDHLREKVAEGYSILIFPEGGRTPDGEIKRFHQGAFHLADNLGIDIQPIMIHGAFHALPKTDFFIKKSQVTLKFFDKIKVNPIQTENDETYKEQAKLITAFYRKEYELLRKSQETPRFYASELIGQYLYKGPVLEWYLRVKIKQEKDYDFFNAIIPLDAVITDVGCGYGFLSNMLHLVSPHRVITGIDYDDEKISVAQNIAKELNNIEFKCQDITKEPLPNSDVFIINDVLHYLPEENQFAILEQCMSKLSPQGVLIVRDADADLEKRTRMTKFTELQSTRLFKFNKTTNELTFISGQKIMDFALKNGFSCTRYDNAKLTSNITYIIKR